MLNYNVIGVDIMSVKQHLIALDLDGTTLTNKQEISQRTRDTISSAIEEGHIVVIATGRPHRASIQYYHMLGLDTPMINFNGALTHHPLDKNWGTFHNPLPLQTALDVIDTCYKLDVHNILAEVQDTAYLDKHDQQIIDIFESTQANQESSPFTIGNIRQQLKEDPTSLLLQPKDEHIEELNTLLEDEHADSIEHRNWGAPWNIIEITKKGINKAFGLKKIAAHYNIPQNRIIAFGDEDNDLEMIEYAGFGVAMSNAIDELKTIANHITETNDQDGVSIFLEKHLKLKTKVR